MARGWLWRTRGAGALVVGAVLVHCGGTSSSGTAEEARPGSTPARQLLHAQASPPPVKPAVPQTQAFEATFDVHVDERQPERNFGDSDRLFVGLSPRQYTYLRFDAHDLQGELTGVKLRLYATQATDDGPRVTYAIETWEERNVTWQAPLSPSDEVLADQGTIAANSFVEYDVTRFVSGSGTYMFALLPDSTREAVFASREDSNPEHRPQLVFTTTPFGDCMPRTTTGVFEGYVSQATYVSESRPKSYGGNYAPLRVKSAPDRMEGYLKLFHTGRWGWTPRSARLRLYATDGTWNGPALYPVSPDWPLVSAWKQDINWLTRPGLLGPVVDNAGPISSNSWVEYDLTSAGLLPWRQYAFGLLPEADDEVSFVTSASGKPAPQVRITMESDPYCTYHGTGGGKLVWARQYGGRNEEQLHLMAADAQGGFVATGHFGETPLPLSTGMVLARFDANGTLLWTRQVTTEAVEARSIAVTPGGDILVVGSYQGTPDLGAGRLPPSSSSRQGFFIARFSSNGQTQWSRGFSPSRTNFEEYSPTSVSPVEVTTDEQGNLLLVGYLMGTLDLGGPPLVTDRDLYQEPYEDHGGAFVAKFDAQGQHVWSRALAGSSSGSAELLSVSADRLGNVLLSGILSWSSDLGDGQLSGPEGSSFIALYTPDGALAWKRAFTFERGEIRSARFLGDNGKVFFTASIGGPFTFGGASYVGGVPGATDPANVWGFVGTLDAKGEEGWLRQQGYFLGRYLLGRDETLTVIDPSAPADLGGGPLAPNVAGTRIARYSATGEHLWSRALDANLNDTRGVLTPDGGLIVGGTFSQPVLLDGTGYTPRGGTDLLFFRLKLQP